jgi:cobalamin biosynthesis Mg chelatase CobN
MKTTITIFAIAAFFTACNSNPKPVVETAKIPTEDTAGLADFKMQKEQEELIQTEGVYDGTNNMNGTAPATTTRRAVSSTPKRSTSRSTASRSTGSSSSGSGTASSGSGTTQAPAKKEGWSKAAKGAVIGGASGAVVGAVVSKKKGKGAIIGGILGAGGGYVIGRSKDKKDGRVQ